MSEQAIVAGGCFWCTEAVFRDVIGVSEVESGYIGGTMPDPDYRSVCSGTTGHAEAIKVEFDPAVVAGIGEQDRFDAPGFLRSGNNPRCFVGVLPSKADSDGARQH